LRVAKVVAATGGDKKNVGGVRRFVLPVGIGDAGVVEDVSAAELEAAVGYMLARAGEKVASQRVSESASQQVSARRPRIE
jgi:3-dehydroquinate synthase